MQFSMYENGIFAVQGASLDNRIVDKLVNSKTPLISEWTVLLISFIVFDLEFKTFIFDFWAIFQAIILFNLLPYCPFVLVP